MNMLMVLRIVDLGYSHKMMIMGCVSIIFISSDERYCDLVCDELEGTEEILLECYGGELSFEVYI